MSLFERFRDTKEHGFREDFIRPLLVRMGFVGISNKHGVNEFGKDYVFSELDPFGQLRHMTIQAKHEEKINQGNKVDDLITQIKQCFNVPYTLPTAPTEERYISSVYVFNSGEITDNAESQIRHALPRELASNTRFFSGPYLETLANTISHQQANEVRERLEGLVRQLTLNLVIWESNFDNIKPDVSINDQKLDVRIGIFHGIEEFLSRPVQLDQIDLDKVAYLWQRMQQIQGLTEKWNSASLWAIQEVVTRDLNQLLEMIRDAIALATEVRGSCFTALRMLPPQMI